MKPYTPTQLWDMAHRRGAVVGPRPVERVRKPRSNEESLMQRQVIKWWRMQCRRFNVPEILLFSVPNGGMRGPITGSILKAEGARKGAPDLFLAVPRDTTGWAQNPTGIQTAHGLFLELKTLTGRLQPEQEVFHEMLSHQNYTVKVCRSFEECVDCITDYLTQ